MGLSESCISWDRMFLKFLIVVLMVALGVRYGDITRSFFYKDMECLCWKDIEITLSSSLGDRAPSMQGFRGKFTLPYLKGKK
jgi:hypothetical protein